MRSNAGPAPALEIPFGVPCFNGAPKPGAGALAWNQTTALNGHMVIAGGSGSGKTHQIRRICSIMAAAGIRLHIIDVHGDIDLPGAHTVKFSESTSFGLNPLEISADPDFGGPRKRTLAFVSTLRRLATLGDRQRVALQRAVLELYKNYGFYHDEPRSWGLGYDPRSFVKAGTVKRYPTIADLKTLILRKLRALKFGESVGAVKAFNELAIARRKHAAKSSKGGDEKEIEALRAKCIDTYAKGIRELETGNELEELLNWDSPDILKGLYDRVEGLEACAVFRGERPDFPDDATPRRYLVSALTADEQSLFVDTMLSDLFFRAQQAGISAGLREMVVIDEAAKFIDDDPDHIINVIFREARKFGLGVLLASQALNHMTSDQIMSACVKFILGVDEMFHAQMESRLALPKGKLRFIKPKRTALVQIKNTGSLSNQFEEVTVPG